LAVVILLLELNNCKAGILLVGTKTDCDLSWLKLDEAVRIKMKMNKHFFMITAILIDG